MILYISKKSISICMISILSIFIFHAKVALSEPYEIENFAGYIISSDNNRNLIGINQRLLIKADYKRLIPGDRLLIYAPLERDLQIKRNKKTLREAIGSLFIISSTKDSIIGVIDYILSEVSPESVKLVYQSTADREYYQIEPLLRWIAERFIRYPVSNSVKIALIDTLDSYGRKTVATDKINLYLKNIVCNKVQFDCLSDDTINQGLWKLSMTTSATFKNDDYKKFANITDTNLLITNRAILEKNKIELLVNVHMPVRSESDAETIEKNWWRLSLDLESLDINPNQFDQVLLHSKAFPRSSLDAKLVRVEQFKKIVTDMVTLIDIADRQVDIEKSTIDPFVTDFFVKINGERLKLGKDGKFERGYLLPGISSVEFGGYLVYADLSGKRVKLEIARKTELNISGKAKRYEINFMADIIENRPVIISDLDIKE